MPKDPNILRHSTDMSELARTAIEFAASDQQADIDTLLASLSTQEFLERLDSDAKEDQSPDHLRLARVLCILMDNTKTGAAHTGLVSLTSIREFTENESRKELLIRALVAVEPSPPSVINFWDANSRPDSTWRHVVMDVICENGSEPAIRLLEKKFTDKLMDPDEVVAWMRKPVYRHRLDLPLLEACKRMITTTLAPALKPYLVEALFDSLGRYFLTSRTPPTPPDFATASRAAREILEEIAIYVLDSDNNIHLTPQTRLAVEAKLKLIKSHE